LPWRQVLEPAIDFAESGFVLTRSLGDFIAVYQDEFAKFPSTAKVFLPMDELSKRVTFFGSPILRER